MSQLLYVALPVNFVMTSTYFHFPDQETQQKNEETWHDLAVMSQ